MTEHEPPKNLADYLVTQLAALHTNARQVIVFDPANRLALGATLAAGGRVWNVFRYDGNDLLLRAALEQANQHTEYRLIWVTQREGSVDPLQAMDLSSLTDLFVNTDDWFDLSITGVLRALIPHETWPAAAVEEYGKMLGANLPAVITGHRRLRLNLGEHAALDAASVRALALHALNPAAQIDDLLFHRDRAGELLRHYMRLAWQPGWDGAGRELLRIHVKQSAAAGLGNIAPWLDAPVTEIARYLYVRRFLQRNRVAQIANQMRGLGVLSFDPEPLEPWVDQVLVLWERDAPWRSQIVISAEAALSIGDLERTARLALEHRAWAAVETIEGPGLLVSLIAGLLANTRGEPITELIGAWRQMRRAEFDTLPETSYTTQARALLGFFDETSHIRTVMATELPAEADVARLIDWYVDGGYYDLEYAHARAADHVRSLMSTHRELAETLANYLAEMRMTIRAFLRQADLALAALIRNNWNGFLSSPRLATNVLSDFIKRRRIRPSQKQSVWFVVFDGMRWDTWQRVVKPKLLEQFEFVAPEKAYLSMLPSWTMVARTSLLTGQPPKYWQQRADRQYPDQRMLAARAFEIPTGSVDQQLRFFSTMEADRTYLRADPAARYPWNILIFNISDDNLHQEKGSLSTLNNKIAGSMDGIMQTLALMVQPDDLLLISSDHGFIELDDSDGIVIRDDARWQRQVAGGDNPVRYRYLLGIKSDVGFAFDLPGFNLATEFTVAISQSWFKRSDDRRAPDRYTHGGLSLAEMVVPGALLRRITEKRFEFELQTVPQSLTVREGEPILLELTVHNRGNQTGEYQLDIRFNSDAKAQSWRESLAPGERKILQFRFAVQAGATPTYVELNFSHQRGDGGWTPLRRSEIPLQIETRKDVVGISFAGLDELDELDIEA